MASLPKLETKSLVHEPINFMDWLTPEELAGRLKVPKSWIFEQTRARSMIRNKSPLPCHRMGKYLRFYWPEVSEWLTRNNNE